MQARFFLLVTLGLLFLSMSQASQIQIKDLKEALNELEKLDESLEGWELDLTIPVSEDDEDVGIHDIEDTDGNVVCDKYKESQCKFFAVSCRWKCKGALFWKKCWCQFP